MYMYIYVHTSSCRRPLGLRMGPCRDGFSGSQEKQGTRWGDLGLYIWCCKHTMNPMLIDIHLELGRSGPFHL